jgi:hypothetical protein
MPRSLPLGGRLVRLVPVLFLLAGACGTGPRVLRVTGTVRYAGRPVPNLVLHFVPEVGRASWGATDGEGRYKLVHDKQRDGAVRGKHKVYFEYRPRGPKEDLEYQQGQLELPPDLKAVLAKYGNPNTTPLSYEVTQDGQVIDIDLD